MPNHIQCAWEMAVNKIDQRLLWSLHFSGENRKTNNYMVNDTVVFALKKNKAVRVIGDAEKIGKGRG